MFDTSEMPSVSGPNAPAMVSTVWMPSLNSRYAVR